MAPGRERETRRPARPARPAESAASRGRGLPGGLAGPVAAGVLALVATAVVVGTDDPAQARIALLALCWSAVVGAFLLGGRRSAGRGAELRLTQELARDQQLRRASEQAVRTELTRLRQDLAALTGAGDPAALAGLRDEIAALGRLRTELGHLRTELTDRPTGELMVERMVVRAPSMRLPADRDEGRLVAGETASGAPQWETTRIESDQWPSQQADRTRADHVLPPAGAGRPAPHRRPPVPSGGRPEQDPVDPAAGSAVPPEAADTVVQPAAPDATSGPAAPEPEAQPHPRSPLEWLSHRSLVDASPTAPGTDAAPGQPASFPVAPPTAQVPERRHRRAAEPDDDALAPPHRHAAPETAVDLPVDNVVGNAVDDAVDNAVDLSPAPAADRSATEPAGATAWPGAAPSSGATAWSGASASAAAPAAPAGGRSRLAEILAENGVRPDSAGRRHRRYRDEDTPDEDDVLARLLNRS